MKPVRSTIITVTAVLLIHAVFTQIPSIPYWWSYILWSLGSMMVIYMVYVVLRYGEADEREWNDGYWYSDKEQITDPIPSQNEQ